MTEAINSNAAGYSMGNNDAYLMSKFKEVQDKQGVLGKAWNGLKEATNLGFSQSDCESMLDKYNNGEISFDEAVNYIEEYERKQNGASDLLSNIATGVGTIAAATAATLAGPIGWGTAIAIGAPLGGAIKSGLKTVDRATNEVEDDAINAKQIAKDFVSGSVTGATSAVSSGIGAGVKAGKLALSVKNGAKCSTVCGLASGAIGYTTDTVLDEDKKFKFGELVSNAAFSGAVSGAVGAVVGGGYYGAQSALGNIGAQNTASTAKTIVKDSFLSSTRKVMNNDVKEIIAA